MTITALDLYNSHDPFYKDDYFWGLEEGYEEGENILFLGLLLCLAGRHGIKEVKIDSRDLSYSILKQLEEFPEYKAMAGHLVPKATPCLPSDYRPTYPTLSYKVPEFFDPYEFLCSFFEFCGKEFFLHYFPTRKTIEKIMPEFSLNRVKEKLGIKSAEEVFYYPGNWDRVGGDASDWFPVAWLLQNSVTCQVYKAPERKSGYDESTIRIIGLFFNKKIKFLDSHSLYGKAAIGIDFGFGAVPTDFFDGIRKFEKFQAIGFMDNGKLFSSAGAAKKLKESLVESGKLDSIIKAEFYYWDSIPKEEKGAYLLCSSDGNKGLIKIRGGSDNKISIQIPSSRLEEDKWNLDPDRYLVQKLAENAKCFKLPLKDVADLIRGQAFPDKKLPYCCEEANRLIKEISVADFTEVGFLSSNPAKEFWINAYEKSSRVRKQALKKGDIVFTIKGAVGKAGMYVVETSGEVVAGQSSVIIRLKDEILKEKFGKKYPYQFLILSYLRSEPVQKYLKSLASGKALLNLKIEDLENLPILFPSQEEAEKIAESVKLQAKIFTHMEKLKEEISKRQDQLNSAYSALLSSDLE